MVGTLLRIQQGKIASDEIPSIIEKKNRKYSGPTAQACGLYLNRVNYENDNSSQKRSERWCLKNLKDIIQNERHIKPTEM